MELIRLDVNHNKNRIEVNKNRIKEVSTLALRIWDEKSDQVVDIGGKSFASYLAFEIWYLDAISKLPNAPKDIHSYFLDIVTLMFSASGGSELSLIDNLTLEHKARQVDAISACAVLHKKTYALILPPRLGTSGKATED